MKKTLISLAFVLFLLQSFSQSLPKPALTEKDYLLLKNSQQKRVGWVLLGGGLVTLFLGTSVALGQALDGNGRGGSSGGIIALTGFGAMVASIPVFISAGKSKRKAAALSFTNQKLLYLQHKDVAVKMQPAITLKISL